MSGALTEQEFRLQADQALEQLQVAEVQVKGVGGVAPFPGPDQRLEGVVATVEEVAVVDALQGEAGGERAHDGSELDDAGHR